ncbi:hypothetical protein [Paenibacillus pseudetheri]|uniref:Uncharacterized protein n=1 Tax=Paenibacillus pseudetheri TaxID=2897682 RepID=A0ABN8FE11_9BACL|nr:hypothetical protein [Paenibacillus pseudetheri]CAH1056109.1 hypothetical protein PAECIP111894_02262 [Paenibacillus pseudetheri]
MKSKRRGVRNGWILTSILCVVMALVLLIEYKAFTNNKADNEPTLTQEMLEFPSSDPDNGPVLIPLHTLPADTNGYQAEGAAYYDKGEWGYLFRNIEIHQSQTAPQQEVVETLMKFFTDHHGPLFIADPNGEKSD